MSSQRFPHHEEGIKLMAEYLQKQILDSGREKYTHNDLLIPVIFLAGAPGAGKTEWIESFPDRASYVILDTDHYRSLFEGYIGSNASEFHQYASRVMDKMYSFCIKQGFNMIVDGTFASHQKTKENMGQCEKKKIPFSIVLVMQDPVISYLYTKKREQEKLRNVPKKAFIEKFYTSTTLVGKAIIEYPEALVFVTKKLKTLPKFSDIQVKNLEQFDRLTRYEYNSEELERILLEIDTIYLKDQNLIQKFLGVLLKNR